MRLLYFAWVKEKTGIAAEDVDVPGDVATVAELIEYTPEQLLSLKSFGEKSLIEIVNKLNELNLALREESE